MTEAVIVNEITNSIIIDVIDESVVIEQQTGGVTIESTEVVGVKGESNTEYVDSLPDLTTWFENQLM